MDEGCLYVVFPSLLLTEVGTLFAWGVESWGTESAVLEGVTESASWEVTIGLSSGGEEGCESGGAAGEGGSGIRIWYTCTEDDRITINRPEGLPKKYYRVCIKLSDLVNVSHIPYGW